MSIAELTTPKATLPGTPEGMSVVAVDGTTWRDFRKRLVPRYLVVWRDIALIHAAVWSGSAGAVLTDATLSTVSALN